MARSTDDPQHGEAFRRFYDTHRRFVRDVAAQRVGNHQADEVTQEVFLRLWLEPTLYDPDRGAPRAFLRTIAERKAIDVLRRDQRGARRELRDGQRTLRLAGPIDDVEESAIESEQSLRVRRALAMLTPQQRDVIAATYFRGLSLRAASRELGIPEGTAKSRMRLALAGLRTTLDPRQPLPSPILRGVPHRLDHDSDESERDDQAG